MRISIFLTLVLLASTAKADKVASVRFLQTGSDVHVTGTASADATTPFAIASVGKLLTAVAVLRYVDKGALSLNKPVATMLPSKVVGEFGGLDGISLRHLLTMTSGLPDYYGDRYLQAALKNPDQAQTPLAALEYVYDAEPLFAPGEDFDYSNTNYVLLGLILEQVGAASYAQILRREVFEPAQMKTAFVFGSQSLPDRFPNGHERRSHIREYYQASGFGDGGVIASAKDLAAFYSALFIQESLLSRDAMSNLLHDPLGAGYGMGVEISDGVYGHSGGDLGFVADVRLDPETGDLAILLVADGQAQTDWTLDALGLGLDQ